MSLEEKTDLHDKSVVIVPIKQKSTFKKIIDYVLDRMDILAALSCICLISTYFIMALFLSCYMLISLWLWLVEKFS